MNNKYLSLILLLVIGLTAFAPFINATPTQFTTEPMTTHYYQRHSWYSAGNFWVYYSDGGNAVYQSSVDGITWKAKVTAISGILTSQRCDSVLASDGVTIHVVGNRPAGNKLVYRMGVCQTDGTITWDADGEQTFGYVFTEVSIALDSQDFPTIIMNQFFGLPEVRLSSLRSSTKDGTFTSGGEGVQVILDATDIEGKAVSIGGQNLYVVYTKVQDNGLLYGKRYDFATKTWGVEDTITTTNVAFYSFSLVSDGSIIYLSWYEKATSRGYGAIRSALGVWTELGDISGEVAVGTPSVIRDSNFGGAWVVWANGATNLKIRHIDTDGVLSTAKTIKSKGVAVTETGILGLEVIEVTNDLNHVGIVYPTATGSSFDIFHIYSDFYITNMEGSDAYGDGLKLIAVEEKFYNFQLDVTGIVDDQVTYASVRFYNNGNLIQVDYNATTLQTKIVSGSDYIMLHETQTSTVGDTISIIWSIWLKSTCLDKENLDIQTYFSLESGANIGWETYPSYCDLGNLYGWVSSTVSGAQSSTTTCSTAITTSVTLSSTVYLTTSLTTSPNTITTTSVTTSTVITTSGEVTTTTLTCTTVPTTTLTTLTTSTTVYSTSTTSSTVITTSATTILKYVGDAGVSQGGDLFDLYTYPNSMAKGQVAFRNLQNVHAVFNHHVDYQRAWDLNEAAVIPIEIGIDYWAGEEYITGWSVKIELTDAWISDQQQYLTWTISWYFNGDLIGTPTKMNTLPIVNDVDSLLPLRLYPASTSFIVDLWYNKMNSSSVVGGRVTAEYYAMKDVASPWLGWWTGSDWTPLLTDSNQVMFFHNLENGSDTIISARDVEMSYFWVKMTQDNNAYNTKYELKDWDVLDFGVTTGDMIGVNTPAFVATKVHSMAQNGFLNSLWASLQQTFEGVITAFTGVTGWLGLVMFDFVDSILAYFGLSGAFRTITASILLAWSTITAYIVDSVTSILKLFELFTYFFGYIVTIFTNFVDVVVDIIKLVVDIFNGTASVGTSIKQIWDKLQFTTLIPLLTIYLIVSWFISLDERSNGSFGKWMRMAIEEVQIFLGVTLGVFEFVINIFYMLVVNLITFIASLLGAAK